MDQKTGRIVMGLQTGHHFNKFIQRKHPIHLICDGISDTRNIGALFRLADASGIQKLTFLNEEIPSQWKKIDKVARSTREHVNYQFIEKADYESILIPGWPIVSIEITNDSKPYTSLKHLKHCQLIVGNENKGVSEQFLNISDHRIHVPMYGNNSSMNVVMATGIVCYHIIGILNPG